MSIDDVFKSRLWLDASSFTLDLQAQGLLVVRVQRGFQCAFFGGGDNHAPRIVSSTYAALVRLSSDENTCERL